MPAEDEVDDERQQIGLAGGLVELVGELTEPALVHGVSYTVRFKVPDEGEITVKDHVQGDVTFECGIIEDFVLQRSDDKPTYHLSNVVDDIEMGITHVVRGADHLSNTPKQILVYEALNAKLPEFAHLPLILGEDGKRLSKRHGATSIEYFHDKGYLPGAVINYLALLGWNPGDEREIFTAAERERVEARAPRRG